MTPDAYHYNFLTNNDYNKLVHFTVSGESIFYLRINILNASGNPSSARVPVMIGGSNCNIFFPVGNGQVWHARLSSAGNMCKLHRLF